MVRRAGQRDAWAIAVAAVLLLQLSVPLAVATTSVNAAPAGPPIVFTNVTAAMGLAALSTMLPTDVAHAEELQGFVNGGKGAAWADLDGDGWQDLVVAGYRARAIFHNENGTAFSDVTSASGAAGTAYGMGVICPDLDRDGLPDLVFTNWNEPSEVFLNDGGLRFQNITATSQFLLVGASAGASFGDVDGDGRSDISVATYYRRANTLWLNGEGPRFHEAARAAGVQDTGGYTFQTLLFDHDGDRDLDILDVNDFGEDVMYRNDGGTRFTDVSREVGVWIPGDGMGGEIADLTGDGVLDLYITNFEDDALLQGLPNGSFVDVAASAGALNHDTGWGIALEDFDNDGWVDIYVANGRVIFLDEPAFTDRVFRNNGGGNFSDVSFQAGVQQRANHRGVAAADFDNDGDVDLFVTEVLGPSVLYRNDSPGGRYLQVALQGVAGTSEGIGATVEVTAGGRTQVRQQHLGSSYLSQHSAVLHFGLGIETEANVTVRWPSGVVQSFAAVSTDQTLPVTEHESQPPTASAPPVAVDAGADLVLDGSGSGDDTGIVRWSWTFDGLLAPLALSGETVATRFYTPGNYTGTLAVEDAFGNGATAAFPVEVRPVNHPLVEAGPDVSVDPGVAVNLSATLRGPDPVPDYAAHNLSWRVEDPGSPDIVLAGRNVTVTLSVPGPHEARVTATDLNGSSGNDTLTIFVTDLAPPVPGIRVADSLPEDAPAAINALDSTDNDPRFPEGADFEWTLTGPNGFYALLYGAEIVTGFPNPGIYDIQLTVTDASGNRATQHRAVAAADVTAPLAEAGDDRVVDPGESVRLSAAASRDNDPLLLVAGHFVWTFDGPDGHLERQGVEVEFMPQVPGATVVRLHAYDPSGNPSPLPDVLSVYARDLEAPTMEAMPDVVALAGDQLRLEVPPLADDDPNLRATAHIRWVFVPPGGEEFEAFGPTVWVSMGQQGVWNATLEVVDTWGHATSSSFHITVLDNQRPTAKALLPTSATVGVPVRFDGSVSTDNEGPLSFHWTVDGPGGSASAEGPRPTHVFDRPGPHVVNLVVTDPSGNHDSLTFVIAVTESMSSGGGEPPLRGDLAAAIAAASVAAAVPAGLAARRLWNVRQEPGTRPIDPESGKVAIDGDEGDSMDR
jgi:PKD repeat protein